MDNHTERMKLAAWLDEWRLDRTLSQADGESGAGPAAGLSLDASDGQNTRSSGLRVGDILLLRPVTPRTAHRPTYVVVWAADGAAGWWRVVPFGRFSTPATPDEIETGLKARPLRVLCLWNGHAVASRRLVSWAWQVGRMTRTERAGVSAAGEARRGPHLIHPLDPRYTYRDEERALWHEWDDAAQDTDTARVDDQAPTDLWEGACAAETPADPKS